MFGITTPPLRPGANRSTQNQHEEIRGSSHSAGYDAGGAERMKMEYLKKEKERRDRERAKLEYDGKKREYDGLMASQERFKSEERRLMQELTRYESEATHAEAEEKRALQDLPVHKKEIEDLERKIHQMEADLQAYKNRHQRLTQDVSKLEQQGKTIQAGLSKKMTYVEGIRSKLEIARRNIEHYKKDSDALHAELDQLKKLV